MKHKILTLFMAMIMSFTLTSVAMATDKVDEVVTADPISVTEIVDDSDIIAITEIEESATRAVAATGAIVTHKNGTKSSYSDLVYAYSAGFSDGDVVTLYANSSFTGTMPIYADITLDLNGYTVTGSASIVFQIYGEVTITDNSANADSIIKSTYDGYQYVIYVSSNGSLDFTGGIIESSYIGIQYGGTSVVPSRQGTMSGTAAIEASFAIYSPNIYDITVSGGYFSYNTGSYCGTLADGYAISALPETEGTFAGFYKVYELVYVAKLTSDGTSTEYLDFIDAVEASEYGDTVELIADTAIAKNITLHTGTTFNSGDYKLTLSENTSIMNSTSYDVVVYYNDDAHTVKSGDVYTAKTLGTPTYVYDADDLISALQADDPYIVMAANIEITSSDFSGSYITENYTGTFDGGSDSGYVLTLNAESLDSTFYIVYNPDDGMVFQNIDVKITGFANALACYSLTGSRLLFDNIEVLDSGEIFDVSNNWSNFIAHNFGSFIMKDCVNNQNLSGTGYQAIFMGGYMTAGATTSFVNCVNNASLIGQNVAFFMGNPSNGSSLSVTDIYITGCVNNGLIRGTVTADLFSKNDGSSNYDKFISALTEDWQFENKGIIEVAEAYDLSASINATTGVISITDNTNTAVKYKVNIWGYATIENNGGTMSTFATYSADTSVAFNDAEILYGTLIDINTFEAKYPYVETYTAPWGENEQTTQPYEIAVIDSTIYYVFDVASKYTLNNTKPAVSIYAYDADGYVISSTTASLSDISSIEISDIVASVNGVGYFDFATALENANSGDTVYILADLGVGCYVIDKGLTFIGVSDTDGNQPSVQDNTQDNAFFEIQTDEQVIIDNLNLKVDNRAIGVYHDGKSSETDRNENKNADIIVQNCTVTAVNTLSGALISAGEGSEQLGYTLKVDNCTFNGAFDKAILVSLDSNDSFTFTNNTLVDDTDNSATDAFTIVPVSGTPTITITGNNFTNYYRALCVDHAKSAATWTIEENIFINTDYVLNFDSSNEYNNGISVAKNFNSATADGVGTVAGLVDEQSTADYSNIILYPYYATNTDGVLSDLTDKGDINADGIIDVTDVSLVLQIATGAVTDASMKARADLNGDGTVNSLDAVVVYSLIQ